MTERNFDIRVPRQSKVAQVTDMLIAFLGKQGDAYIPTEESVLCDMESGSAFDPNVFIETAGLQNGSRVMLV